MNGLAKIRSSCNSSMSMFVLLCALLPISTRELDAKELVIDLGRISRELDIRSYIAEHGELPPGYVLIGNLSIRASFLPCKIDMRREIVEYDHEFGKVFKFLVPSSYRFLRYEEQRDGFYFLVPRDLDIPGLEISIEDIEARLQRIRTASMRKLMLEEIRYNLSRERAEKSGRGLLSIDIPIALPKSIERIIGKGEETNLTVQGSERLAISGTSNWCSNCPRTEGQPRQEKFPDLDLDQQLNLSLKGTIGQKINVEIQHSSLGSGIAATNRVRLNYRGFDDDVIKLIEMGDTDLSLQGAQLVSYSGAAKGLFGVKMMAQAGPLDLTVIASKEEGESVSGSYSSTGGRNEFKIQDIDFVSRQFFYLENPGPDFRNPRDGFYCLYSQSPNPIAQRYLVYGGDSKDSLEVFESLVVGEDSGDLDQIVLGAYIDADNDGLENDSLQFVVPCRQLYEGRDYELMQVYGVGEPKYIGIMLKRPLADTRNLLVRYRSRDLSQGGNIITIGDYKQYPPARDPSNPGAPSPIFKAELICRDKANFLGSDETWQLMMRNIYSIGRIDPQATIDVAIEDLDNRDNRDIHPASKIPYLRLFGLDQYNQSNQNKKDGLVDVTRLGVIDRDRGLMMIPWYEPFNPDSIFIESFLDRTDPLESTFSYSTLSRCEELYKRILTGADLIQNHKYNIVVSTSSGRRNIQLAAYDIIEGSEVVTVDGTRLARGIDYDIDYASGEVTIKTQIPPGSRIKVDYQYKPLIGGGKNSLLGLGGNLNFSPNARVSGTFLYSSQGAPKYAPRLGEEPSRTMAADVNTSFVLSPKWMTSLANLLPRVDTDAKSTLNVGAEAAASFPNPNVKGEALIDDMEGIAETDQVSLLRRSWYPSSLPYAYDSAGALVQKSDDDRVGNFFWYNAARTPQQEYFITSRRDLNPNLDPRENATVTTLFFDAVFPDEVESGRWCGVMTAFPNPLDLSTAQYLEIWINDFQTDPSARGGTVHIDFGRIDEDFYKPGPGQKSPDDEKKTEYPWTVEEDTGFDSDDAYCSYPARFDESTWIADWFVYRGINCRKGNQLRDTEDLNGNLILDRTNAYYTLTFNLADTAMIDIRRDFPPDDPEGRWNDYWSEKNLNMRKAWRKYRIDLSKARSVFNAPPLESIQYVRIWLENPDSLVAFSKARLVEFAEMQFVGNRWEYDGIRDFDGKLVSGDLSLEGQKLIIGTINNKDDPGRYRPPYAVMREEGIANREQSLTLKFENFADSTAFRIVKRFFGDGQNYQQYRDFQFFLYGESIEDSIGFYLQLATDENNYYEIEVPLGTADRGKWQWINLKFSDLTNLKMGQTRAEDIVKDAVDPSRTYMGRFKGNPSLFRVRYLFAGLRNRAGRYISGGEVWFNDIRVGGVRRDIDHAERLNFSADFAGILQLVGGWQRTGSEFRSLRQSRGEGYTSSSLSMNARTELGHFIPTAGFTVPLTMNLQSTKSLPKYVTNSDVEIMNDAVRDSLKNVSDNIGFTVGLSRRGSTNFLMRTIFDNLRGSFGYSRKSTFTPNSRDTTTAMSGGVGYQLQFRKERWLKLPGGVKWRYWLSNFSYEGNVGTTYSRSYTLTGGELVMRPAGRRGSWTNGVSTLYEPFESVKINYSLSERRDLASNNEVLGLPVGFEVAWGQNFNLNYQPGRNAFIISEFNPRFEFKSSYGEDRSPGIRTSGDPEGTRSVSASRNIAFTLDFNAAKYINRLGRALRLAEKEKDRALPKSASAPGVSPRSKDEFLRRLEEQRKQAEQKLPEDAGKIVPLGEEEIPPGEEKKPPPSEAPEEQKKKGGYEELAAERARLSLPEKSEQEVQKSADSVAAKPDTTAARKRDPLVPIKKLVKILGSVEPVRANFLINHSNRYERIYDRASLLYQFGLTDESGAVGPGWEKAVLPLEKRDNFNVDLSSGVELTGNIAVGFKARFGIAESDRQGKTTTSRQNTWPSINLNWRSMEQMKLLGKYFNRSDLGVNFERQTRRDLTGKESSYSFVPTWTLEWKNKLRSIASFTYSSKSAVRNERESWEKTYGANLSFDYNIEGAKGGGLAIPFMGDKKIAFKSTLNTKLSLAYASNTAFNRPRSSSIGITPSMSYRFSNNVSGSLGVSYNRNWGGQYGYVYNQLAVRVEGEFRF